MLDMKGGVLGANRTMRRSSSLSRKQAEASGQQRDSILAKESATKRREGYSEGGIKAQETLYKE